MGMRRAVRRFLGCPEERALPPELAPAVLPHEPTGLQYEYTELDDPGGDDPNDDRWYAYGELLPGEAPPEQPGLLARSGILRREKPLFIDGRGHLDAELQRIGYLVRVQLRRYWGSLEPVRAGEEWSDVSSYSHVQAFIGHDPLLLDEIAGWAEHTIDQDLERASQLTQDIDRWRYQQGEQWKLQIMQLAERFSLSPREVDVLLIALLPELHRRFRVYFTHLQQDTAQPLPNLNTVREILDLAYGEVRSGFRMEQALLRHRLIHLDGDDASPSSMPQVRVDPRVVSFLLRGAGSDARLSGLVALERPPLSAAAPADLDEDDWQRLTRFRLWIRQRENQRRQRAQQFYAEWQRAKPDRWWPPETSGATLFLYGRYGAGKRRLARAICAKQMPLLVVGVGAAQNSPLGWETAVDLIYREGRMHAAAVYWVGCETLLDDSAPPDGTGRRFLSQWEYLLSAAEAYPHLTFLASELIWEPQGRFLGDHTFTRIDLPAPAYDLRVALWRRRLGDLTLVDPLEAGEITVEPADSLRAKQHGTARRQWADEEIDALAERLANSFQFTAGQMDDALRAARSIAVEREPGQPVIGEGDVFAGCRRQTGRRLTALARPIVRERLPTFEDLQLPESTRKQLDELLYRVQSLKALMNERGIDRRKLRGKGIVAMFTGSSGTGKTTAAEALAGEAGVDLYKVDLSAVVSKWVGETEKQLNQVFTEAEAANAMLFFDEGDALFSKRGEVREAQDRWANQEVNFLLQRIEEYSGVVILATNFGQNIDSGFRRRIHSVVEFPFPDRDLRRAIWRQQLASVGYPPLDDAAFEMLAGFHLAGGSIQNIALTAIILPGAQSEAELDPMKPLVRAIAREYQKLGRPVTRGGFGANYFKWLDDEKLL